MKNPVIKLFNIFCITIISIFLFHDRNYYFGPDVKSGQIWEKCSIYKGPFEKQKCEKFEVLDVKDGYVLYGFGKNFELRQSSKIKTFVYGRSKLIEDVEDER